MQNFNSLVVIFVNDEATKIFFPQENLSKLKINIKEQ